LRAASDSTCSRTRAYNSLPLGVAADTKVVEDLKEDMAEDLKEDMAEDPKEDMAEDLKEELAEDRKEDVVEADVDNR